jgi:hypothetical protein
MYTAPRIIASFDADAVLTQAIGDGTSCATADVVPFGHGCK